MSEPQRKICIAGATGMAGASVIEHVLECYPHLDVVGTYHRNTPWIKHDRLSYVQADLTLREDCRRALHGCDGAILVAANTGGAGVASQAPHVQVSDNLVMDTYLLEACHLEGISRLVFVSSATVYQEFDGFISEAQLDWSQDPHAAYLGVGWAKRAAEKLCSFWHAKYGLSVVIARCANIYGPYAKFDPQFSNFVPALIRKAAARLEPFEIWGSPDVTRDVIYAGDFARAVMQLLTMDGIGCETFNLGTGIPVTVGRVVDVALAAAGHAPAEIRYAADKPVTIAARNLDCRKIQQATGWRPVVGIEQGIGLTMQWWLKNKDWWRK